MKVSSLKATPNGAAPAASEAMRSCLLPGLDETNSFEFALAEFFAPLKENHFEVQAYCLRYAQYLLSTKAEMHKN